MFAPSASTSTFGQSSGFNSTVTPFGGIGTTQQPQSSLFGQTSTQQTPLFGSTGLAQPSTTSLFGNTQQQTNAFGTQSAFGGGTSLFGSTATNTAQTSQTQSSLFGNANRFGTTSAFGTNTGLGGTMNLPTGTTIKFQPQTSTDTMIKNGQTQNTSINIRLQCITCMREYETKALEELRLEDYAAGRKGPQQQTGLFGTSTIGSSTGTSAFSTGTLGAQPNAFGQSSTGSSLFGNTQKPFGSIAPTTAGTTSIFNTGLSNSGTSLFGQNTTQPAFGQSTDNKSLNFFGQTSTSQPFSFGQTTSTLGANSSSTSNSLFGNTGTTTSIFGQNQNSLSANKPMFGMGTSLTTPFGQNQQQQTNTSLFGNTSQTTQNTGFFGTNTSQSFNTNQSTLGKPGAFNFQSTQPLNQTSTFNPSTNTSLFGNASSTGNTFGTGTTGTSLFGTNTTFGATNFNSFGTNNTSSTQPFGSTNTGLNLGVAGNTSTTFGNAFGTCLNTNTFGQNTGLSNTGFFGNNLQQNSQPVNGIVAATNNANASSINPEQIMTRLKAMPYGTLPPISSETSTFNQNKTKFTTDPKTLNQYKLSAKSQNEVNKVQRIPVSGKPTTLLFDGLDDESPENLKTAADIFKPRQNIKKLVLNKSSSNSHSGTQLSSEIFKTSALAKTTSSLLPNSSASSNNKENALQDDSPSTSANNIKNLSPVVDSAANNSNGHKQPSRELNSASKDDKNTSRKSIDNNSLNSISSPEKSYSNLYGPLNFSSNSIIANDETPKNVTFTSNFVPPKCGVILTRPDYYTIPSLSECDQFYNPDDDTCIVDSFTVFRIDYGSIFWRGPLNIKGLNLDEIVHIRRKEVIVYPDDDAKPPEGEGLNRPAQITLDQVWPVDKTTREFIKDPERLRKMKYAERLEKVTIKLDATFKEYRPDTGSWVFHVKHFSKYGLEADEEDDEIIESIKDQQKQDPNAKQQQTFVKPSHVTNKQELNVHLNGFHSNELDPKNLYFNGHDSQEIKDSFSNKSKIQGKFGLFADDDDDNDDNFNNINENDVSLKSMKAKKDDYSLMRSTLFVDQNDEETMETMTKKCKNLSFSKMTTASQISQSAPTTAITSTLFPSRFLKTVIPKKRRLIFEQLHQQSLIPQQQKVNVYSLFNSNFPKAHFINGSNRFCLIVGNDVLIFEVDLLQLDGRPNDAIKKLELQFDSHSTIDNFDNSNNYHNKFEEKSKIPPLIRTNSYCLNEMVDSKLNLLIEALYGELNEIGDYARHQERFRRIMKWLYNYNKTLSVPESSYNRIIHFLTTNELEFAVTECINAKLPRLSYLISCGQYLRKELIVAQLDLWKRSESDQFISKDLLKIYIILSGLLSWKLSNGKTIDTLDGLEWTQQLCLLLLYKTRNDVEMIGTNLLRTAIEEINVQPDCVEYHLLAQHQPWIAITSAKNYLDAWMLQEQLQSYNVIIQDISTNKCDSINIFMASQCKDLYWSLFFALHIRDDYLRTFHAQELLNRNAKILMNDCDLEQKILKKYQIDSRLISEAKYYWSRTNRLHRQTAMNLLAIGRYKEAHEIFVDRIFPELVINEDYREIYDIINKLQPHRNLIPNWDLIGAGIYDIFIKLLCFGQSDKTENLNNDDDNNNDDLKLQYYNKLIENFNVHQLRTPTNRHVLCQSQMARFANIIHSELNMGLYAYHTSVPDDYSLLELRSNAYKIFEMKTASSIGSTAINVQSSQ